MEEEAAEEAAEEEAAEEEAAEEEEAEEEAEEEEEEEEEDLVVSLMKHFIHRAITMHFRLRNGLLTPPSWKRGNPHQHGIKCYPIIHPLYVSPV